MTIVSDILKHPAGTFLERLEHHGLAGKVHAIGREGQGFRNPAPGVMQDHTEGAHLSREVLCAGEREAMALPIV